MNADLQRRLRPLSHADIARRIAAMERAGGGATIAPTAEEAAARAAIDGRRCMPQTDEEWRKARSNFLNFISILAEWGGPTDHEHA